MLNTAIQMVPQSSVLEIFVEEKLLMLSCNVHLAMQYNNMNFPVFENIWIK